MKKIWVALMVMILLMTGCSFNVDILTPVPVEATSASATQFISSPVATISATAETQRATPDPTAPLFYGAYFTLDQAAVAGQSSFPEGTKRVFVIWNYQNMREGLVIRREWFLNGAVWAMPEEPWNFARYGTNGTMRDISVYDLDNGLGTGKWELRIYINNVPQPINAGAVPDQTWATFEVLGSQSIQESASPNFQWGVTILGEKQIVIKDASGNSKDLYTGREIAYLTWLDDNRHFLFVDRDRSGQQRGTTIGIRDDLWIADAVTGATTLLYKNDTNFAGRAGPVASADSKYIASLEGSGFGDACKLDSRLIFFELADNLISVKPIQQDRFAGLPASTDGFVYPVEDGEWETNNLYLVTLDGTCTVDKNKMGPYLFNLSNLTAAKSSSAVAPLIPGDLGWGKIHGKITDAVTGAPIVGATVSCEHHSYTSPVTCSGTATTNADGIYVFGTVFFHDTDTVKLTVQATGYQPKEITQASFTAADMEANINLNYPP